MNDITYAYKRFCTERFPLPTDAQVSELEWRIRVVFPKDYREFVLQFNGGYFDDPVIAPVPDGCPLETLTYMSGIGASHPGAELGRDDLLSVFDGNVPPIIVPIGYTGLGSLVILRTGDEEHGAIYLKEAFGGFHYLAEGIEGFFDLLRSPDMSANAGGGD
ncbi:MAG TPA: SMI1/KNR4 family protein [Pirellulales bacterium]|nr:SMI1/KNR4 family protein [Pirellulales bacterium]